MQSTPEMSFVNHWNMDKNVLEINDAHGFQNAKKKINYAVKCILGLNF